MRISQLALRDFPPFADAILEFPPRPDGDGSGEVHLLTGQNGTGKTRLLCLLAAACGNLNPLYNRLGQRTKAMAAVTNEMPDHHGIWLHPPDSAFWLEGPNAPLMVREMMKTCCLIGNAERSTGLADKDGTVALAFRGMAKIADTTIAALAPVNMGAMKDHLSFDSASNEDQIICQSMANLVMVAAMDTHRGLSRSESRATRLLDRLEGALSDVTGRQFSFEVTPPPEVTLRVVWGAARMRLLQLPDGLRSIIGWLVSCVSKLESLFPEQPDPLSVPLILLLDEPEGHLHPAWQRKVLPAAQTLFPQAQIFAATHSPFVISSVNEGWVHIFQADDTGLVRVQPPRECSKGDTYLDVVEDILGVKEWYDPETEGLLAEFRQIRDAVVNGSGDFRRLKSQASVIAGRSASLRDLMARELRQVERLAIPVGTSS